MKPIPDFVIYLAGLASTISFVFCGIYFVSNRVLGIWTLYVGLVFGLLVGVLYWQNDLLKKQSTKAPSKQIQQPISEITSVTTFPPLNPEEILPKEVRSQKKPILSPEKTTASTKSINTQTAYSQLTNDQLRKEVLALVDKMRGYLERRNLQEQTRSLYYQQQMKQAKTEGERQIVWGAQTHDLLTSPNLNFEYSEKFKADAVLLRDEIVSRLPKDYKTDDKYLADYNHPTNPIGLNMVIDDLEKVAKAMPK